MEHPEHQRRGQRKLSEPPRGEDDRPRSLDGKGHRDDTPDVADQTFEGQLVQTFLQREAIAERNAPPEEQCDEARRRHIPEAADLDQDKDHQLANKGEVVRSVHDDRPVTQTARPP